MKLLSAMLLLLSLGSAVYAQEKPHNWPSGSAMAVGLEARENVKKTLEMANKKQSELLELIKKTSPNDSRLLKAVEAQYIAFVKYYPVECELLGAGAGGSWPSTWATLCEENLIKEKLYNISSIVECVDNALKDNRPSDVGGCVLHLNAMATETDNEETK